MTQVSPFNTVTLDGSGGGRCAIGPPAGTRWELDLATLAVTTSTNQPQGLLYRGSAQGPQELVDTTYTGAQASSGKVRGTPFYPGQLLWAVWTGGDAGAVATLRAFGAQVPRDAPFVNAGGVGQGFDNPIAAGTKLVIPALQSPNFQTGVSGWSINRDGSAEFLDLLVRGTFETGGTGPSPHILFASGADLPAPIDTYQFLGSLDITSAIVFYGTNGSPDNYFFIGFVDNIGAEVVVMGYVRSGAVQELSAGIPLGLAIQAASQFPLPPGSMALSQSVDIFGNLNITNAQGPAYVYGFPIEYTSSGSFDADNFPGMRAIIAEGMGSGSGGGFGGSAAAGAASAGGGGGGGGYAWALLTATTLGSTNWTVTVPAGGAGGTSAVIDGSAGAAFTIASGGTTLLSAAGASTGGESVAGTAGVAVAQGGTGGVPTVGDFMVSGSYGSNGVHGTNFAVAGEGGAGAVWGMSVRGNAADAGGAGVSAPANSGSGGSGGADQPGSATNRNGGAGGSGRGRIHVLY